MDKYDVIGLLGEGSFGRVYKARKNSDGEFVALKVISKRGRSSKELKGLRRECEIQRYLHHPNIIQMLDSFETENEIVVITEFAHKELNLILGREGYLPEERVQKIVWDLLSALYYLHSNRVLHRDLKPQNILLDENDVAKLCDFGFARNMSTGTHVLTSIKGTPLYMAPELIEEQPYDHNADLWSLGCIIYELLVGAPPFCTTSILHLIRLIKHEQISWPTFISNNGISFLKGLLQKNPSERLTWPEILSHPFVRGHILITEDTPSMPLTRAMSANTLQAKEQQKMERFIQKSAVQNKLHGKQTERNPSRGSKNSNGSNANKSTDINKKSCSKDPQHRPEKSNDQKSLNNKVDNEKKDKKPPTKSNSSSKSSQTKESDLKLSKNEKKAVDELCSTLSESHLEPTKNLQTIPTENKSEAVKLKLNISEDTKPIENEEWLVFLQKTIVDLMNEDMTSLVQTNMTNIIVSPLRNSNSSSKIVNLVAKAFALPFVIDGLSENVLEQIYKVYLEVKLIPNLVYSSKLMMKERSVNSSKDSTPTPTGTPIPSDESFKAIKDLTDQDLHALENIYCLMCYLVHHDDKFLEQFCDSIVVLNVYELIYKLLTLSKRKVRIVTDLVAILTNILRKTPENYEVLRRIFDKTFFHQDHSVNFLGLLRDSNTLLRERVCRLFAFLTKCDKKVLENVWNEDMKETVEALMYDSMENVRNAAELCVEQVKPLHFYNRNAGTNLQ